MAKSAKNLVREFYTSDLNPELVGELLHPEAELFWNSSSGFKKMKYQDIVDMISEISKSFSSLRSDISHILKDNDNVCIRFTYHVRTMENPREELPMAHFIAIWEIRDGKLFKGHQISQPADDSPENLSSFLSY